MSSSEKSKKIVDKFINIEKEKKTNKIMEKVKLNNNNDINIDSSKNSEYLEAIDADIYQEENEEVHDSDLIEPRGD